MTNNQLLELVRQWKEGNKQHVFSSLNALSVGDAVFAVLFMAENLNENMRVDFRIYLELKFKGL